MKVFHAASTGSVYSEIQRRTADILFSLALCITLTGVLRSCFLPEKEFIAGTIIDDALYNVVPAQNLLAGNDYSFDKMHRTNGVQPLWAVITVALVALCPDRLVVLRVLVLLGGLLWVTAGIIVYRAFRHSHPGIAALGCSLWLFTIFTQRVGLQGMENGLTAVCLALLVVVAGRLSAAREEYKGRQLSFHLSIGIVAALISLCRVEMVILPALLVLTGLLGCWTEENRSFRARIISAFVLGAPTAILFGCYVLVNLTYFGGLLPVSGAVKQLYNQEWLRASGWPFGGFWACLKFHLTYPWGLATFALTGSTDAFVFRTLNIALRQRLLQMLVNIAVAAGLLLSFVAWLRSRGIAGGKGWGADLRLWTILVAFILLHLLLLAFWNPYFTLYGTWYFTPQIMLSCAVLAGVCWVVSGMFAGPLCKLLNIPGRAITGWFLLAGTLATIAVNFHYFSGVHGIEVQESMLLAFRRAGEWLSLKIPGGERVATLSSGFINYYAPNHKVINLDGLMNDYEYFEGYLKPGRVDSYFRDKDIRYFADYFPTGQWKEGFGWRGRIPLERMQLLRWWPVGRENAYAIWRILPPGTRRDVLDPGPGPYDRLSQLQFAAAVMNRFPVVEDSALKSYLSAHPGSVVATSFLRAADGPLEHVLMRADEFRSLGMRPEEIDMPNRVNVRLGGAMELLGFDVRDWTVRKGGRFVYTVYWRCLRPLKVADALVEIYINPSQPGWFWHREHGAHGTLPLNQRRAGDVTAETYVLAVPADIPAGRYPVHIGIWSEKRGRIAAEPPLDPMRPGMVFLGNLVVQ